VTVQVIRLSSTIGGQYTGLFSLAGYTGEIEVGHRDDGLSGDVVENSRKGSRSVS
jgi:hypothetical protein